MDLERLHGSVTSINLNVRGLGVSATLWINEYSRKLEEEGRKIYRMGLGQSPFPVPEVVAQALRDNAHQKDYLPVKGLYALRQAVAEFHRQRQQIQCTAEDVLIGPGSKELMFLLQLVYYGDLVIPTPSWVSYAPQAMIVGRNVRWLNTLEENGWRLTAEELAKYCEKDPHCPRIVILNYPDNPTGDSYDDDELQALAEVARRYKIVLLSDEIYGELHHQGQHRSIAAYYPEGTIVSSGLSKWCGAGGWRLGTFVFPESLRRLQEAMAVVASETYTSTSAPIQYAAVRAFQAGPEIETYLRRSRKILKLLGGYAHRELTKVGLSLPEPVGGFYLFPNFSGKSGALAERGIASGADIVEHLLADTGVAILPGSCFGRPEPELTARIAYVNFDGEKALAEIDNAAEGPEGGAAFLEKTCGSALEAIDAIRDWYDAV